MQESKANMNAGVSLSDLPEPWDLHSPVAPADEPEKGEPKEEYIQVGYTALRNPISGAYMPAVPLYIKAGSGELAEEQRLIDDLCGLFAAKMKAYEDACKAAARKKRDKRKKHK